MLVVIARLMSLLKRILIRVLLIGAILIKKRLGLTIFFSEIDFGL